MRHQTMSFRASIISPITWSLMIPIICGCTAPFFILLANQWAAFGRDMMYSKIDFFMILLMLAAFIWIVLMWIYFLTLKVTFEENCLTKSSWLSTTSVVLDDRTLIRHRADQITLEGVNLSLAFAGILSNEACTHMQITIRDATSQIKVGSALKGISKLREALLAFESETLVPATLNRLRSGETVLLPPFEFQRSHVTCKGHQSEIPLPTAPELEAGELHCSLNGKQVRIALKKIWNPLTSLRLLTQGSS